MTILSPALDAELSKDRVLFFEALQLDLASGSAKLLNGPIGLQAPFAGFVAHDLDFGTIASVDEVEDGTGDDAPGFTFALNPPSFDRALAMSEESDQGAKVRFWIGCVNPDTGAIVGDALLLINAEMDVPTLNIGPGELSIEYDAVSGMERYFDTEEGITLSPTSHKQYWPDELGLDFVTGVTEPVYWGLSHSSAIQEK